MAIIVFVTAPHKQANPLAEMLLNKRLCACVNIIEGVTSCYWWNSRINTDKEALLIIKTLANKYKKLEKAIRENHPYETPEIIAVKADYVDTNYLKWLKAEAGRG